MRHDVLGPEVVTGSPDLLNWASRTGMSVSAVSALSIPWIVVCSQRAIAMLFRIDAPGAFGQFTLDIEHMAGARRAHKDAPKARIRRILAVVRSGQPNERILSRQDDAVGGPRCSWVDFSPLQYFELPRSPKCVEAIRSGESVVVEDRRSVRHPLNRDSHVAAFSQVERGSKSLKGQVPMGCAVVKRGKIDPLLECAPGPGQVMYKELTGDAGLSEDESHGKGTAHTVSNSSGRWRRSFSPGRAFTGSPGATTSRVT